MKNKLLLVLIITLLAPLMSISCTMYKITKDGKTIVGNNEDWISPNSQFWFEAAGKNQYGVMYMGLLNNFAQGAINEAGLVFDGFANPELPVNNSDGKENIPIRSAIRKIMQEMSTAEEVRDYLSTINLSSLSSSQVVFVDKSGTYLIVEGDELILGEEKEKAFSNFYYSQVESEADVNLNYFQNGLSFLNSSEKTPSLAYCGNAMQNFANSKIFGTQYTTIYDLNALKIRVYLFHDYSQHIEIDLMEELKKGNHKVMIADLFPKESEGYKHYVKYNNTENPSQFLEELVEDANVTEAELIAMDFNTIINTIGYEWLNDKNNPLAAIDIFKYGISILPKDADLYDSLGEAYFVANDNKKALENYKKSLELDPDNKNAQEYIDKINQL